MKISIIMPAYNSERYVRASIDSILSQSYRNIELIVVDDGSTDTTGDIVKSISDSRLKYIYQQNKGVRRLAETINAGLSVSSGELVTMFPSDDICEKDRFALQIQAFNDPDVVLSFGKMKMINEAGDDIGVCNTPRYLTELLRGPSLRLYENYILENFIPQPTVLLKKSILLNIGGYIQHSFLYAEDYPTQMEFVGRGKWIFIDAYLAKYRIHDGQKTKTYLMPMFRSDARYRLKLVSELSDEQISAFRFNRKKLRRIIVQKMYYGYYKVGRSFAARGDKKVAIKYFTKAMLKSDHFTAIKSFCAMIVILFGINLESVLTSFRKIRL